jgi:hypothetical protein
MSNSELTAVVPQAPDAPNVSENTQWPADCDPQFLLNQLRLIDSEHSATHKALASTYKEWVKMGLLQRNRTMEFYNAQSNAVRHAINSTASIAVAAVTLDAHERAQATHKNDRARLISLYCDVRDPNLVRLWAIAKRPMTRVELDDDQVNAWRDIADNFNNYAGHVFQNECIKYHDGVALNPYQARNGMERIANKCYDLNPNDSTRPLRDGEWVRLQMRAIKAMVTKVRAKFKLSGSQQAENLYDEWCKYAMYEKDVIAFYVKAFMTDVTMEQLGKALPDFVQRDTGGAGQMGAPPSREYSTNMAAENRRRQRLRKAALRAESNNNASVSNTGDHGTLTALLAKSIQLKSKFDSLTFLAGMNGKFVFLLLVHVIYCHFVQLRLSMRKPSESGRLMRWRPTHLTTRTIRAIAAHHLHSERLLA